MKKVLCAALGILFLVSCNMDDSDEKVSNENILLKSRTLPVNGRNPFDNAGLLFNVITTRFYEEYPTEVALYKITSAIDDISHNNDDFQKIDTDQQIIDVAELEWVIANASDREEIIASLVKASGEARQKLMELIILLDDAEGRDFDYLYEAIVAFEGKVITDSQLSTADQELVLTVSSLSRFNAFMADGNGEDKDWRTKTGVMAAMKGADQSMAMAIKLTAAARLFKKSKLISD